VPRTTISAQALRERLGDPKLVVVDCRHSLADFSLGRRLYDASHLPGAYFADVETDLAGPKTGSNGRHPMPEPETFGRFLRAIGVDDDTTIVAYDAGADMFAARLWLLSRWIGHDEVAVLDGGFAVWQQLGYPVSAAPARAARPGSLTVRVRPSLLVDAEFVRAHLHGRDVRLLDGRAHERYSGEAEPIDPVAGHIPGAAHRWFKDNFDERGLLLGPERLRDSYLALSPDPSQVVHYCGSGVSSAVNALAMEHAGLTGSRVYAGSWSEWVADPDRPVATGTQ